MKHVVMIIANSPNPSYFKWFAELNHQEKACKLSFVFLHTETPALCETVKAYGVESHVLYFNTYISKPLQYIKMVFKLYFLFKKIKPDVVQTNLFDDTLPGMLAAKLAGVKKRVITKQDTGYHVNYAPWVVKYDKFNNRNATHLIAVSEESKEFILKHEDGDVNKITMIHHGVDEQFITSASSSQIELVKNKFNLAGKLVVGTVARYIPLKGYADLIEAASMLTSEYPHILFLGVGYGAQLDELNLKIKEKNLQNNFVLTDLLDYELMPAVYHCMDIYVHAAQIEPFGFVLPEAMFNKKPIITTRVGAARDVLIHQESAYLINYNSPEEIANGIRFIMNNNHGQEMASKGYNLAKAHFAREFMWNNYKSLFLG